jgi:hypothetical protein
MNIIHTYSVNIGFDIGDGLTKSVIHQIPCSNTIQFIMPEINTNHSINIYIGNNKLSKNNILLFKLDIISPEKVIYIDFIMSYLLYFSNLLLIKISTKTKLLNVLLIPITNIKPVEIIESIDIDNYKLKFELVTLIDLLKNKINKKEIILSSDILNLIYQKIDKINSVIDTLSNQKLLDIKNNLKAKFFL